MTPYLLSFIGQKEDSSQQLWELLSHWDETSLGFASQEAFIQPSDVLGSVLSLDWKASILL